MKTVTVSTRNFCFNLCFITSLFSKGLWKDENLSAYLGYFKQKRERNKEKLSSFQLRSGVTLHSGPGAAGLCQ